jgi:hypothetical protein
MLLVFVLLMVQSVLAEGVMVLQLSNEDGVVNVENVELIDGQATNIDFVATDYNAEVVSLNGKKFVVNFTFPQRVFVEEENNRPLVEDIIIKKSYEEVYVPYYPDVKELNVYDDRGRLVLNYDLKEYRVCNDDGLCLGNENEMNCPNDCAEKVSLSEKKIKPRTNVVQKQTTQKLNYLVIFAIIIIVIIFYIILKKRKK